MAKKFALSLKVMNFLFVLSVAYMQEQSDPIGTVGENRAGSKFDAEILQYHVKTEIILVVSERIQIELRHWKEMREKREEAALFQNDGAETEKYSLHRSCLVS